MLTNIYIEHVPYLSQPNETFPSGVTLRRQTQTKHKCIFLASKGVHSLILSHTLTNAVKKSAIIRVIEPQGRP